MPVFVLRRADVAVTDSHGRRRGDTVGAATRARFHALPTVGQRTAKQWWDLGCRWVRWAGLLTRAQCRAGVLLWYALWWAASVAAELHAHAIALLT